MLDHPLPVASSPDEHHPPFAGGEFDYNLLIQAASALGKQCQEGVPLTSIKPNTWWVEHHNLHIPYPGAPFRYPSPPHREDVEQAFSEYRKHPWLQSCSTLQRFRLLHLFSRAFDLPKTDILQWRKILVDKEQRHFQKHLRQYYTHLINANPPSDSGVRGNWIRNESLSLQDLVTEIHHSFLHPIEVLKKGKRATLWLGTLQGEDVVIKKYEPNPRAWRRSLERCRATRAWAGASVLLQTRLSVPEPLGWVEITLGPEAGTSFFITKPLPPSETVRVWLRREWKQMSPQQRCTFRHSLRKQFQDLYANGLVHLDSKLSNLRIKMDPDSPSNPFIWTDLEDIRPQRWKTRTFLRNLYQMNGSLPREISEEERVNFLKGFHHLFSFSTSPGVKRYIKRVTRKRHRRELRRQCGA